MTINDKYDTSLIVWERVTFFKSSAKGVRSNKAKCFYWLVFFKKTKKVFSFEMAFSWNNKLFYPLKAKYIETYGTFQFTLRINKETIFQCFRVHNLKIVAEI